MAVLLLCFDVCQIDWGDISAVDTDTGTDGAAEVDFDISGITLESGGTDEGKVRHIQRMSIVRGLFK